VKTRTIWIGVVVALTLMLSSEAHAQQGGATVALNPPAATLAPGEEIVIEVMVSEVENLYGFELHLSFDPALLEVMDADSGQGGIQAEVTDSFLKPEYVVQDTADNDDGKVDVAVMQLAPTEPASGSGVIARVTFKARASGEAAVNVDSVILADDKARRIDVTAQGAKLAIRQQSTQPPRPPTSTPTEVPNSPTPTLPAAAPEVEATATPTVVATTIAAPTVTPTFTVVATAGSEASATPTLAPTATSGPDATPTESPPSPTATATPAPSTPADTPKGETATAAPQATPSATEVTAPPETETPAMPTGSVEAAQQATAAATATASATATSTPAKEAMAVEETPAIGATEPAAQTAVAGGPGSSFFTSVWFIVAVVAVLIFGSALLVLLPRERRRETRG